MNKAHYTNTGVIRHAIDMRQRVMGRFGNRQHKADKEKLQREIDKLTGWLTEVLEKRK